MDESTRNTLPEQTLHRRIRHAMRILENEQTPLPETRDVAERVGLSVFHFVRLFERQVGLSPRDYGRAVLLTCAASRLRYSVEPIAVVAKDFGYAKQATFNKAFTRHHGIAPARWRRQAKAEILPVPDDGVRLEERPAQRCLARRYFGARSLTGAQWADFTSRLPTRLQGRPRIGFSYDDPRVTPPERIRHDCALVAAEDVTLTERLADEGFELLESPAGLWAMVDVPPERVRDGYRTLLDGWFRGRPDYALEGDPHLEVHGTTSGSERVVTVCLRVRPVEQDGDFNMAVVTPNAVTPADTAREQAPGRPLAPQRRGPPSVFAADVQQGASLARPDPSSSLPDVVAGKDR